MDTLKYQVCDSEGLGCGVREARTTQNTQKHVVYDLPDASEAKKRDAVQAARPTQKLRPTHIKRPDGAAPMRMGRAA